MNMHAFDYIKARLIFYIPGIAAQTFLSVARLLSADEKPLS